MVSGKKNLSPIRIYDCGGDLTKNWFIEWKEGSKRIRKYKGINIYLTEKERLAAAKKLQLYWEQKLKDDIQGFKGSEYNRQYQRIQKFIEKKKGAWRLSTYQQTKGRIRIFLEWNERSIITKQRLEDFLDHLRLIGRKQNTVGGYYQILFNVIGGAIGQHLFEGINEKKGGGTPARYFSAAQVRFLSRKMQELEPELWLGVQFIFYCFIRPAELRLLKVSDVLLDDAKICIPAHVSKNKKTQYVIIPQAFLDGLYEKLIERNPSEYLIGGNFSPIGKNWLKNRHQKLLRTLHFDTEHHKLYSWKHTGAVMAVKNGVHIKQLQLQLRHHSLDQVNAYLRQMGIFDMGDFSSKMPKI